ncbi:polymer-forming cytoskeletal protein [Prosthecobacter sp.]|uniref:polymer-forming cytoskeletal protein n=1 Tax=Prosthecobacter sp. TaxID=1965333 RepID=UPI003784D01B
MNHLFSNIEIQGSLTFSKALQMDGSIVGDVHSSGPLVIGEQAVIKGTVNTQSVVVCGSVEGNITVQDRCEVKSTAIVMGNITAATFSIEEGATFCGHSRVRMPSPPAETTLKR